MQKYRQAHRAAPKTEWVVEAERNSLPLAQSLKDGVYEAHRDRYVTALIASCPMQGEFEAEGDVLASATAGGDGWACIMNSMRGSFSARSSLTSPRSAWGRSATRLKVDTEEAWTVPRVVSSWKVPVTPARHAIGPAEACQVTAPYRTPSFSQQAPSFPADQATRSAAADGQSTLCKMMTPSQVPGSKAFLSLISSSFYSLSISISA